MTTIGFKDTLKNIVAETEHFALRDDGKLFGKGFYLSGNGYMHPIITKFDESKPAASAVWQATGIDEAYCVLFHQTMLEHGAKWATAFPPFVIEWARKTVGDN